MPMRRETLKALEHRREDVMNERKQSGKMQTLGASNPYNNNKDKHRNNTKLTGKDRGLSFSCRDNIVPCIAICICASIFLRKTVSLFS